jgi:S1-C subfamily serine protease
MRAALCLLSLAALSAPAAAHPSLVRVEAARPDGVRFQGYPLPRASEGLGVTTAAREVTTAAHLVWGAQRIAVIAGDGTRLPARIERIDAGIDAALLAVARPLRPQATLRVRPVQAGEALTAFAGSDAAAPLAGRALAPRWTSHALAVPLILTDIKGAKGASGGGLFDARGQLVGIVIRIDRTLGYLSALPAEALCNVLARCALAQDESQ